MKKTTLTLLTVLLFVLLCLALCSCEKSEVYDVTFTVDGELYASVSSSGNGVIPVPPDPTKEGFTFEGWYYDEGSWLEPFDRYFWENTALGADVTVYAKWKAESACQTHTPGTFSVVLAASCAQTGLKMAICSVCGEEVYESIEKSNVHTPGESVEENRKASSCAEYGSYDTVVYCTVCSCELSRTKNTVGKLEHTPDDAVSENIVKQTCIASGSYDEVVYCALCDEELSRTERHIDPSDDAHDTASNTCSFCGKDTLLYEYSEQDGGYLVIGALCDDYSSLEIPRTYNGESVVGIAGGAFANFASLSKITIPVSIVSIGEDAFSGCTSLTSVTYKGKKTEWKSIAISDGNDALTSAKITYNNFTDLMPF